MKELIPLKSKNNRSINAKEFNSKESSFFISLQAGAEFDLPVPPGATGVLLFKPDLETVFVSTISGDAAPPTTVPSSKLSAAEPASGVKKLNGETNLYFYSPTNNVTIGAHFYLGEFV